MFIPQASWEKYMDGRKARKIQECIVGLLKGLQVDGEFIVDLFRKVLVSQRVYPRLHEERASRMEKRNALAIRDCIVELMRKLLAPHIEMVNAEFIEELVQKLLAPQGDMVGAEFIADFVQQVIPAR